mmetsp:Transcript_62578/g.141176  ORF Transcript_62578/g.141176 Transcript_62578/m.141176 type:complete len:221 (+) Transcript_62578:94-756(+)
MGACASETLPTTKPILYYMPIAARGEVTRMIAKIGGTEIEERAELADKASFGSPSSLPCLEHGDLKLSQSHAIVSYMIGITPKYKSETSAQVAKDLQINAIMDDIMSEMAKVLFNPDKTNAEADITKTCDKWYPIVNGICPESGFFNGLPHPTAADFAAVIMCKGFTPFVGSFNLAGKYDPLAKNSRLRALVERTLAVPEVKKYLEESTTRAGNPFSLPE